MDNANAVLPTAPAEPIEPTGAALNGTSYTIFGKQYDAYETAEHWDQEIINVLQVKFPPGLTDLEIEEGMLPLTLTGWLAIEHIERKVISSTMATKAYLHLVEDFTNRPYVPNGSGSVQYFQDMKRDQLSATVVKTGLITDEFIILYAQHAFMESGHVNENFCSIDV